MLAMNIFFESWESIERTLAIGIMGYAVMVVMLRISGPRTLSKMNAFDFIVTIALGSTFASLIVSQSVSLASGAMAFAVLIGLQFCVTWASVRMPWVERVMKGEPRLVLSRGEFLRREMRRARVTEEEVFAAVRSGGHASLDGIGAVVLETDGSFSVIGDSMERGEPGTLRTVRHAGNTLIDDADGGG